MRRKSGATDQGRAALGHARLSIIDLEGGAQPMLSADGRYAIVFNGEIYNFQPLRKLLEQRGRVFRTRSDTEVLLQAYIEWGVDALPRLDGMFAFAIYDALDGSLLVARDRVGIKPLYYHSDGGTFAFASEIKALLKLPGMPRRLDYQALADYLSLGYPMAPTTFFSEHPRAAPRSLASRLRREAAGRLLLVLEARRAGLERSGVAGQGQGDAAENARRTHDRRRARRRPAQRRHRFVAAGVAPGQGTGRAGRDVHGQFRRSAATTSHPMRALIAKHLGLVHRKVSVPSDSIADLDEIHAVLDQFDQPFVDSSAIPTHLLCRELRKHVKVAIGGDGGDETFGGYPRFYFADLASRLGRCPSPLLAAAECLAGPDRPFRPRHGPAIRQDRPRRPPSRPAADLRFLRVQRSARAAGASYSRRPMNASTATCPSLIARAAATTRQSLDGRDMIDVTFNVTLAGRLFAENRRDEHGPRAGGPRSLPGRQRARSGGPPSASLETSGEKPRKNAAADDVAGIPAGGNHRAEQIGVRHSLGYEPGPGETRRRSNRCSPAARPASGR